MIIILFLLRANSFRNNVNGKSSKKVVVIFFPKEKVKLNQSKKMKNEFHYSYENIFDNHSGLEILIPI